jgi:hypothetical protein
MSQISTVDNDIASVSDTSRVSTAYAAEMPPPPSRSQTPQTAGKRHRSHLSTEELEKEAYTLRVENMERRINELKQAKNAYDKAKELAELEKWAQEHGVSI